MDIAGKYIFDNSNQLRLFLSPKISTLNQDATTDGTGHSQEIETSSYTLGVGSDYLWTLTIHEDISAFSGSGLILSYGKIHNNNYTSINDSTNNTTETNITSTRAGLRGILGVEWKASEKIGIQCILVCRYCSWRRVRRNAVICLMEMIK